MSIGMITLVPMDTNTHQRVRVTLRALIGRINRKLAKEGRAGKRLFTARSWSVDTGHYYVVDLDRNVIEYTVGDPVELARELGVLRAWEEVAS